MKETKKLDIRDSVNITDEQKPSAPAKGIIRIYGNDGKLVREIHNTIVKTGRQFIFERFLSATSNADSTKPLRETTTAKFSKSYADYKFGNIHFAYETEPSMTTETTAYADIELDPNYDISFAIKTMTLSPDDLKLTITQTVTIPSTNSNFMKFNEIYITIVSAENVEVLFSRALIDPLYLGEDTTYDLDYSFYF